MPDDLLRIAMAQPQHEDEAARHAHRWLFCDTTPWVTLGYSGWMFGTAPEPLRQAARRRYDLLFLCAPDIPFDQDGTRVGEAFRAQQHAWYLTQLQVEGVEYVLLEGDLETRIACVQGELAKRADNRFSVAPPL